MPCAAARPPERPATVVQLHHPTSSSSWLRTFARDQFAAIPPSGSLTGKRVSGISLVLLRVSGCIAVCWLGPSAPK